MLLDSYWFNIEDEKDNDEMVALINRIGISEHIPLEARLVDLAANEIEKIHNKGVIVDDQRVLVSSINWNSNSPNFNREAGVIIDHRDVARYFLDVFEDDWNSSIKSHETNTDYLKIVMVVVVLIFLVFSLLSTSKSVTPTIHPTDGIEGELDFFIIFQFRTFSMHTGIHHIN